ncbi:MAG: DUF4421 domain-containing protein [Leptospirales bacterium]|nr:DUF4421 domain-containing protein [Leptospirales bacterium]
MNKKLFYILLVSFFLIAPLYAQEELEETQAQEEFQETQEDVVEVSEVQEIEETQAEIEEEQETEENTYTTQDDAAEQPEEYKGPYFESFNNKFSLRLSAYRNYLFDVTHEASRPFDIGLGLLYKNFELELRQRIPLFDDSNYPKTKTQEWQFNYYAKSTIVEIQVKDYKTSHTNYDRGIELRCTNIFAQYVWNYEKYSWQAAFNLSGRQFHSAESLLLGINAFYMTDKDDWHFAPYKKRYIAAIPHIGKAVTGAGKSNLFLAIFYSAGIGIVHESSQAETYPAFSFIAQAALGYHFGDVSFMVSCKALLQTALSNDPDADLSVLNSTLQCSIAKRF